MKLIRFASAVKTIGDRVNGTLRLFFLRKPVYVSTVKNGVVYKKFNDLNNWYTRIIGLDEVKAYQDRVVDLQEKLLEAQTKRREIGRNLGEIRRKSNELKNQLHRISREDEPQRFLNLMTEETELLKQEKVVTQDFHDCDKEEREIFTAFTNSIRDSHEKQRAQLEYTKYFGLVLSIVGSVVAFMFSSWRKRDMVKFLDAASVNNQAELKLTIKDINDQNKHLFDAITENNNKILQLLSDDKQHISTPATTVHFNKIPADNDIILFCGASLLVLILIKFLN